LALTAALTSKMLGSEVLVTVAMRYWRPFIEEAARAVAAFGPDDIVLLPLYPQYSTTTTGSSTMAWAAAYNGSGRVHSVCCYPERPGFIEAHLHKIREILGQQSINDFRVVFSAHGLPENIVLAGDPYPQQIERSAEALAIALGAKDWRVSYQSRVGPMRWIGPTTIETLEAAGREGVGVLVVPIAFVSEHSETLVELDCDYGELALRAGVPTYLRAAAIGIDVAYVEALADMALEALDIDGVSPRSIPCKVAFSKCPFQQRMNAA
jgi:ferrochelatase